MPAFPASPSPCEPSATTTALACIASPRRPRRRVEFWRSPEGQPPWARPVLLGIAALAGLLYAWNITSSGLAPYYSVAARSMTESWKAFLFTAYDPAATLTLDKIGGFLWPQALSARLFGFHDWALTLPQCLEGVISALVLFRVVRRWQGPAAGLLAAALFTLTPVTASLFGHAIPDAALIMCLLLAADQGHKALYTGRLGPLLLAAVWVGLAFQAKMLQAWLIAPALALAYLTTAPVTLRRRLARLLTATTVMTAVSLSWALMMTFTPKDTRPYADGTTNNSASSMVFEYNGFGRLGKPDGAGARTGAAISQARGAKSGGTGGTSGTGTAAANGNPRAVSGSDAGNYAWHKLLTVRLAAQIGWLYPLALIGLAFGLLRRERPRTVRTRAGWVLWGTWLLTTAAVLSVTPVPHTAYAAALAPALAALSAAGIAVLWRAHRADGSTRLLRTALPATIAVQAAWAVVLVLHHPGFAPWLPPLIVTAALLGSTALVLRGKARRHRLPAIGLAVGCLAMFAAPATWSLSVLDTRYAGSAFDAHAGPDGPGSPSRVSPSDGPPQPSTSSSQQRLSPAQRRLLDYVQEHNGPAAYTLSSGPGWARSRGILATGLPVLPLGGASGQVPSVTLGEYRRLVASGKLRFALLYPQDRSSQGVADTGAPATENEKIDAWVRAHCRKVDPRAYGGEPAPATSSGDRSGPLGSLYDCSTAAS
ncbi:ArnT family glycosyltransferase [Streptomyces paromomycinus]|uniref:Glycosyl transferase n=1 Tax=Streptomyces paromomycinus TaxID=92743 RepID=A0A401WE88_STREY|nr:glycosyltransferase family 39 protein [Streptomyces paromomycinus]GCD47664.1 glycosyl transferase [Streptomyces paromomycinus]